MRRAARDGADPGDSRRRGRSERREPRKGDPGSDTSEQASPRAADSGRHRTGHGTPGRGGGRADRVPGPPAAGSGSPLFAPGYETARPAPRSQPTDRSGEHRQPTWYGSAAGGGAGKGPVRGYPPVPGQPPPMYPPGQFAAWNRDPDTAAAPVQSALAGPAQAGLAQAGAAQAGAVPGSAVQAGGIPGGAVPGSQREPGYSMLAVSDPAADVTSTQTWQAVAEGRATGIWTMPRQPDAAPGPSGGTGRSSDPHEATHAGLATGAHRAPAIPAISATAGVAAAGAATGASDTAPAGSRAAVAGQAEAGPTAGSSPSPGRNASAASGPATSEDRSDGDRQAAHPQSSRRAGSRSRRSRPRSVKLAMVVAILLVISAAATLAYTVLRSGGKPRPAAGDAARSATSATPSVSPSPSLGPYGHISSRSSDPQPLTVQQLFPASFTVAGSAVTQTASRLGKHCGGALTGSKIQSAVSGAGCSQVVRATYLFSARGLMGTIGVLNLSTAVRASKLARSADASDYITPLTARRGPTRKIGGGTGIEEAAAKGHYLILIWAEYTSLRRPKTTAQRTALENFMTALLRSTANVSLTNRMLTGTP